MNNNNGSDNCQGNRQKNFTSQRIRIDGLIVNSTRNTDISVYLPKTPYNERKTKSPKGSKGFSHQQNENIELALYKLGTDYGFNNCKWFVFTFDEHTSDEALINLLTNFSSLHKAIKYIFDKNYKHIDVKPYIVVYGLKKRTSYSRDIPCLDINIVCAFNDISGKQLISNEQALVKEIYQRASKYAEETIQIPSYYYKEFLYNSLEDHKQLANYLKNQVDSDLLKHFKSSQHASLLPKTYVHIPESMKKTFVNSEVIYLGSTAKEHREILQKEFNEDITIKDTNNFNYKCIAQLNSNVLIDEFLNKYKHKYISIYPYRIAFNSSIIEDIPETRLLVYTTENMLSEHFERLPSTLNVVC